MIPDELREVISEDQSTLCSDGRHILHAGGLVLLGEQLLEVLNVINVVNFSFGRVVKISKTITVCHKYIQ